MIFRINPARFIILFFFLAGNIKGQVISGIVKDKSTGDTIAYASVFFQGTFMGTNTDQSGNFSIDLRGKPFMPLSVSAVGYYTTTITEYSPAEKLNIYLKPKVYHLQEVVINAEALTKQRKANMKLFREVFFGTSVNASRCILLNAKDLTFNYASDHDTLRAFAYKPLLITNPMLGYSITYHLDSFYYVKKTTEYFIRGEISFEEDLSLKHNKNRIERWRNRVYDGSLMQFFGSLWANKLTENGFVVSLADSKIINLSDSVVFTNSSIKIMHVPDQFYIRHKTKYSLATALKDYVRFDKYGIYVPDIIWQGDLGARRIGDWLPMEWYGPD